MSGGERAYVYAKACGIIAKSFLAQNAPLLLNIAGPADLEKLLFPSDAPAGAEGGIVSLEKRIMERSVRQIITLLSVYKKPADFLVRILRSYEYADLKLTLSAYTSGDKVCPPSTGLGAFSTVNFAAYPDLKAALAGTEFAVLLPEIGEFGHPRDLHPLYEALDRLYYTELTASLARVRKADVPVLRSLLREEVILSNIERAMRLRVYYDYRADEVLPYLIDTGSKSRNGNKVVPLAQAAIDMLEFELDNPADWNRWRYRRLLNRESPGVFWKLDPRAFQNAASVHLYNRARLAFRRHPFALDTLALFIKLKQFEEQILCSIAEASRLGIKAADVFATMGIQP
jgi:vacuolar-type H+-ATPase subunit C/Vma6